MKWNRLKNNLEKPKRPKISSGEDANRAVMTKRSIFHPLKETMLQPKEVIGSVITLIIREILKEKSKYLIATS